MRDPWGNDTEKELPGVGDMARLSEALKYEEEVQRQIEEGNMCPHERALYILAHGSTGQKLSMLEHFDRTIKDTKDERKITQVLTELTDAMWTQDLELQVQAPEAIIRVLAQLNEVQHSILLGGLKTMLEVRTADVRKAWNNLALEIVAFLPVPVIVKEIVPIALRKGDHSEPHDQRVLCCNLIGRVCRRLEPDVVVNTVLSKALALCQDTNTAVRVAMCGELPDVARAIGLELTKEKLTVELFELLVDEEKLVSRSAFTCLIDLVEFFDPPYRREHFYPIIKSYISNPPEEVLSLLIEEFGRFLVKIKSDIQVTEDIILFASFFKQCAQRNDPEVRRMCAYNFPAVVASLPSTIFPSHLAQLAKSLAMDPHPPVRRAIAAGMHELFPLLSDRAAFFLREPFLALAMDPLKDVRSLLFEHLSAMLSIFSQQLRAEERAAFFTSCVPALVGYENDIQKEWRRVNTFFNGFANFPEYFSPQVIHDDFLPILFRHLANGAATLKDLCAQLIVRFTEKILCKPNLVVNVFSQVTADFGRSASCYNRISFILLFRHSTDYYSRRFIRDRMLDLLLELAKDPVSQVRIAVAKAMPHAKLTLRPPAQQKDVACLNAAMELLVADTDAFVAEAAGVASQKVSEIDTEYMKMVTLKLATSLDDIHDRQREEKEGNVLDVAKDLEKQKRDAKIREYINSERERELNTDLIGRRPVGKRGGGVGFGVGAHRVGTMGTAPRTTTGLGTGSRLSTSTTAARGTYGRK